VSDPGLDTAPALGLHIELGPLRPSQYLDLDPPVLFAPLPDDALNVERWVFGQLDAWGVYVDRLTAMKVIANLDANREELRKKRPNRLRAVTADLTRMRPMQWTWDGRVLLGGLSLIIGKPKIGKGTQAAWMLARLTKGELDGEFKGRPVNVAIIGTEDSFDHVWSPRIHAAGGDLSRVVKIELPDGGVPELRADKIELGTLIQERDVTLVYLDALLDNLGFTVNSWHDKQVREALRPAAWLADELEISIVGSLHPNKSGETFDKIVSGARAFSAVARSTMLLAMMPDSEQTRVFLRGEGNYGPDPQPLEWDLEEVEFEVDGRLFTEPVVANMRDSEATLDELMQGFQPKDSKRKPKAKSKVERAADFIYEKLNDGEPHEAAYLISELAQMGITSDGTLAEARKRVKVRSFSEGGRHWWQRPESAQDQDGSISTDPDSR
jgi:hypothetical protein